jgi:hypothetical protein
MGGLSSHQHQRDRADRQEDELLPVGIGGRRTHSAKALGEPRPPLVWAIFKWSHSAYYNPNACHTTESS